MSADGLCDMERLPDPAPGILLGLAPIADAARAPSLEPLDPRWRPKRAREFAAGRNLARRLLRDLGEPPRPLPFGRGGAPVWPSGLVGSIAHTDTLACAALGPSARFGSIGVDLEPIGAVGPELHSALLTEDERISVNSGLVDATTLFCCKEAVLKATFPRSHEFFDFLELTIEVAADGFQAFTLTDTVPLANLLRETRGTVRTVNGHRLACFITAPCGGAEAAERSAAAEEIRRAALRPAADTFETRVGEAGQASPFVGALGS